MEQALKVEFIDSGREPQCEPNPAFPDGQHIDSSMGAENACTANIPYPAPRCGLMIVECPKCGMRVALTVAGRIDDPRTVKIACKQTKH